MLARVSRGKASITRLARVQRPSYKIFACFYPYSTFTSRPATSAKAFKASSFGTPKNTGQEPVIQDNTVAVPQEDIDDFNYTKLIHGNTDLRIAITKRASDKLTSIAQDDKNPNSALKISVESGGCHGFQYNLKLADLKQELADEDNENLVFKREGEDNIAQVVLDQASLEILQDSKIDYTKELIGSSFKVVDSPYTSTACGCGASFDFDFDKLEQKKRGG